MLSKGDRVSVKIQEGGKIVNTYEDDFECIKSFEVIGIAEGEGYIVYVPQDMYLYNEFIVEEMDLNKFSIDQRFLDFKAHFINQYHIYEIKEKLDGMICNRCREFFKYAEPNQPDGSMKCWNCRNYKFYR